MADVFGVPVTFSPTPLPTLPGFLSSAVYVSARTLWFWQRIEATRVDLDRRQAWLVIERDAVFDLCSIGWPG